MSLTHWLQNLKPGSHVRNTGRNSRRAGRSRPAARFRPRLEALEDRFMPSTLTVVNTHDSGPGSLRAALTAVNHDPHAFIDAITFAIGSGVQTIMLSSALPTVTHQVHIDGTSQPGFAGTPLIELDGAKAGASANGLTIAAGHSTVDGLVINRFGGDGILLTTLGGDTVRGNYIGTDVTGTLALANGGNGVDISAIASNTVGGTASGQRNLISGNGVDGVLISGAGASFNHVLGNYVGTDVTGTLPLGNVTGVYLDSVSNNTVGGTTAGAGNLISGNGFAGVFIYANGTLQQHNVVAGNFIGTDVSGTTFLGNGFNSSSGGGGLVILGASGNTVGGTTAGARNLISANANDGVLLLSFGGSAPKHNLIEGNYIGTDVTGTVALGNAFNGVVISAGSSNSIGGTVVGAGNLISGSGNGAGIQIFDTGNLVQGNYIGTDVTGSLTLGFGDALDLFGGSNTIGGTTAGARNLLSGGVLIRSDRNLVQGNYIGTDVTGTLALGFGEFIGVYILSGSFNTIGGTTAGARNIISGNADSGVRIESDHNLVQGNYIGTDVTGILALGNGDGVEISGGFITIGGTTAGARNLISGNFNDGVLIEFGSGGLVEGNYIGTDVTGTMALGNGIMGVEIQNPGSTVGGTTAGARNLISGNGFDGVSIDAEGNGVEGNYIGTDVTGTKALGNGANGVVCGSFNIIGGTTAGARNLISSNVLDGVVMGGTGSVVEGNYIGTDVTGTLALGNHADGVEISGGFVSNNTVGGTTPGTGNIIAFNGSDGVFVNNGTGNAIQHNSIFSNLGLGIDLNAVNNANNLQAAPVFTSAISSNGTITIAGSLTSTANTTYTLEFFSNPAGTSQGKTFLGSITVTTDATGLATFTATFAITVGKGQVITGTATDPLGDTSEFSAGQVVT